MIKFPAEVMTNLEVEAGLGYQPEFFLLGPGLPRTFVSGVLASLGISVDFTDWIFEFEFRYNYGLTNFSEEIQGGRYQDIQVILGSMWHF